MITAVEARLKDPKNPKDKDALGDGAYFNLGAVYMILEDYENAVKALERCHKLSLISNDETLTNLGISYLRQKPQPPDKTQRDKARKVLQQAIALNPNNNLAQKTLKTLMGP